MSIRVLMENGVWLVPPESQPPAAREANDRWAQQSARSPAYSNPKDLGWYALHVRSCMEARVRARLTDAGVEAFFPNFHVVSRDKRRTIERNLFPGYVFAHLDLSLTGIFRDDYSGMQAPTLVRIPELVGFVGAGRNPIALDETEIEAVKVIVQAKAAQPHEYLSAGDRVRARIGSGEVEGYVVYLKQKKDTVLVVVSVTMLGRSVCAEVKLEDLELVEKAA